MLELTQDTLFVFVSDSHIGGDPGCDGFESPGELEALFGELAGHAGPVELVLAGDFFDLLQISGVPPGSDRAALTLDRPEYAGMFGALERFNAGEQKRVVYLPGNHDAEVWWNPRIRETLRERGLVDEFAFSYTASVEVGEGQRTLYCEHGNQFDPANAVEDYGDPLDTPLGHHIVTDFTRRVAPFGEVSRGLDLSEIKNVYPLVEIPQWVASRYFYNVLGTISAYLLLPLLAAYAFYRGFAYLLAIIAGGGSGGDPSLLSSGYRELPRVHELFLDIGIYGLLTVLIFAIFFLVVRREVRRIMATVSLKRKPQYSPASSSQEKARSVLRGEVPPPMDVSGPPGEIDVFVSGHTHLPSLSEVEKDGGGRGLAVNSGCWLRQLQPVPARLKGPPVFVSKFVLTHVRVFAQGSSLRVELWEHPKPAGQRLTRAERLFSWKRLPAQPALGSKPRVRAASAV